MKRNRGVSVSKYLWILLGSLLGLAGIFAFGIRETTAVQTPGGRYRTVDVVIKQYLWDVYLNSSAKKVCQLSLEYDRQPTNDEVMAACADLFQTVLLPTTAPNATPLPTPAVYDSTTFLDDIHLILREKHEFKRTVKIPMQDIIINLDVPDAPTSEPYAIVTAYEPEIDFKITAIHIHLNSGDYLCKFTRCRIPIPRDTTLEFWADSSFGDESVHVTATIRISGTGAATKLTIGSIYPLQKFEDSCAQIWGTPVGSILPVWETFPPSPEYLHTNKKYYYLSSQILKNKVVNASDCPGGGFLSDGSPNACGMERASTEMVRWQNQYDTAIWSAARDIGIPPVIIKGLIEIESQFWPSNIRYYVYEYGLAQINQLGADVALRWDNDLYKQICNGLFYDCSVSYASLPPSMQAIVRGGLVRSVNSECPTCQYQVDYAKADQSIPMVARIMRSNCRQANYLFDQYEIKPSYDTAWKFTLVSYHSGYYCLDQAIRKTIDNGKPVVWENLVNYFGSDCAGAADYVNTFWSNLETFAASQVKLDYSGADIPFGSPGPTQAPTPTATPMLANSTILARVFIDRNKNGKADEDEGVDNLTVVMVLENGQTVSRKTSAGKAVFDLSGIPVGQRGKILLPTQLLSKSFLVPATGELEITFQLQQSILPPILP